MKQLLLSLLLLLAASAGQAQPATWTFALPVEDSNGVMDVATGADGNFYVTGRFTGTMQLGATVLTSPGQCLYVAKCAPTGEVLRVTQLETTQDVLPKSIAVDPAGNSYVTGYFSGTLSYLNGKQAIVQRLAGYNGSFVLKCRPDGVVHWLRQAELATAQAHDFGAGAGVAVDAAGNCYVTGNVGNAPAPSSAPEPGPPIYQAFVLSYDATGALRWAREWTSLGGGSPSTSKGMAVAVDNQGQCFVSSSFYLGSTLGNVTLRATPNASDNSFLARYAAATGELAWTAVLPTDVTAGSVAPDNSGRFVVGGLFKGTAALGAVVLTGAGPADGYVARYNQQGRTDWATTIGSPDYDAVNDIAVDPKSGKVFATGIINFASDPTSRHNTFLVELSAAGQLLHRELVAGPGTSTGTALALDAHNNVYTTGIYTASCGFGALTLNSRFTQAYLARYGSRNGTVTGTRAAFAAAVSVFPNPAQQLFYLQLQGQKEPLRATLYNQLGQAVAEQTLAPVGAAVRTEFSTAALANGLYLLRLTSARGSTSRAVLVQH